MDKDLLAILCCPETRQPLHEASSQELAAARGRSGEELAEGLVREDGKILYPVRDGIPVLIVDQGISLEA
jgi:uncharacterized protein YbaR (Trm112 family)